MKKAFFVGVFVLLTSFVFAQRTPIRTSDGEYYCNILYRGQYVGQREYDQNIAAARRTSFSVWAGEKLTRGQWEAVDHLLNRYNSTQGDTYYIIIDYDESANHRIVVICEYTSNTQYNYWNFRYLSRLR